MCPALSFISHIPISSACWQIIQAFQPCSYECFPQLFIRESSTNYTHMILIQDAYYIVLHSTFHEYKYIDSFLYLTDISYISTNISISAVVAYYNL